MEIVTQNERLQEAILQAQHGHRVHPCHYITKAGACSCGKCDASTHGKHPALIGWQKAATTNEDIIRQWWEDEPEANVGLATGPGSDLLIVDIDVRAGKNGFADLQELDPVSLGFDGLETPKARTGSGGAQLYFRWPRGCKLTTGSGVGGKAIDYRGQGGNAIAPGSRNNLGAYTWILGLDEAMKAECPGWLLKFLETGKAPDESNGKPAAPQNGAGLILQVEEGPNLETHPGAGEGQRNALLCKLVGAALAAGTAPDEVMRQAIAWNRRCNPAKGEAGIRKSVQSIISKEFETLRARAAAKSSPPVNGIPGSRKLPELITRLSADVEEEELVWLWWNRFLIGHINIIAGDPGLGKSLLAVDAAARVSTGKNWPDGSSCEKGKVIYCTTEDAFSSVVKPRLTAAGADHKQITFVEGVDSHDGEGALFLDEHMHLLEDCLTKQEGQVRLLILDTLQSYVGAETNTSNNASSRRIMTPLKRLAEKHHAAVLCLEHLTKGATPRNATYRVQGSIAFTGAARSVWIVCKDPQDPQRRIVQAGKCNLSPDGEGLGLSYTIEGEVGRPYIVWGETNISTPLSQLMGEEQAAGDDEGKSEFHRACEWLTDFLSEPRLQEEIMQGAKSEMIAEKTLRRAKKHLLIGSKKIGTQWHWMPSPQVTIGGEPAPRDAIQDGQDGQGGH